MPPKRAAAKKLDTSDVFAGKIFSLSGTMSKTRDEITKLLEENGGTVASSVTKKVTHLITTSDDVAGGSSKVNTAEKNDIFIVNEDYVHESIAAGEAKKEDSYSLNKKRKEAEKKVDDDDDDEEEEDEKNTKAKNGAAKKAKSEDTEELPVARKSARSTKGKKTTLEDKDEEEEVKEEKKEPAKPIDDDPANRKKIVVKGKAAVDTYCSKAGTCHVLESAGIIYDSMLNQTNIGQNNNKFYVVQVLEKDGGGEYWTWNRWGRVGEKGQNALKPHGSNKQKAIADFEKKFYDKSKNDWNTVANDRAKFKTFSGKYTLLDIDYDVEEEEPKEKKVDKPKAEKKASSSSKLDNRVQDLVKLIFDLNMMESVMTEMEYDVKKMPLGKLKQTTIKKGYSVLKELDEAIKNKESTGVLSELSSKYYTLIPHTFGRNVPPVIKNSEMLKKEMAVLEALADIEIATKIMENTDKSDSNPIDVNYSQLKCDIEPIDNDSEEFKHIATYVKNTHQGSTPKIQCIYRINREGEKPRFDPKASLGNRKLLWHGSRLTNYVGIISQGLRIAPPEAPVSGYRFGKGIYFADIMSLSSIYCRSGNSNDFCMLLGDVALGKEAEVERDTYMEKPQPGSHSTKALGTIEPSPSEQVSHKDGYVIPNGKIVDSGKKNVSCREHQYIVYDVSQVHLKYLLHLN